MGPLGLTDQEMKEEAEPAPPLEKVGSKPKQYKVKNASAPPPKRYQLSLSKMAKETRCCCPFLYAWVKLHKNDVNASCLPYLVECV